MNGRFAECQREAALAATGSSGTNVCNGPTGVRHAGRREELKINRFRQGQRIVQVDPKIANSAVHFGMPEQKLNSA